MSDRGEAITPGRDIAPDGRDRRVAELEGQLREAQATIAALRAQIVDRAAGGTIPSLVAALALDTS